MFSHGLSLECFEELIWKLREKKVTWGNYLFKQGDQANEICFIVSGTAEVVISTKGQETIIDEVGPGSSFGGYSVINGEQHTMSLKACYDITVLTLEGSVLDELRESFSDLDHFMMEYESLIERTGMPYCDYKVY